MVPSAGPNADQAMNIINTLNDEELQKLLEQMKNRASPSATVAPASVAQPRATCTPSRGTEPPGQYSSQTSFDREECGRKCLCNDERKQRCQCTSRLYRSHEFHISWPPKIATWAGAMVV